MMLKLTLIVILGIFWCNCIQPDPGTKGPTRDPLKIYKIF